MAYVGKPVIWGDMPFESSKALAKHLGITPQMIYEYIRSGRKLRGEFVDFKI